MQWNWPALIMRQTVIQWFWQQRWNRIQRGKFELFSVNLIAERYLSAIILDKRQKRALKGNLLHFWRFTDGFPLSNNQTSQPYIATVTMLELSAFVCISFLKAPVHQLSTKHAIDQSRPSMEAHQHMTGRKKKREKRQEECFDLKKRKRSALDGHHVLLVHYPNADRFFESSLSSHSFSF